MTTAEPRDLDTTTHRNINRRARPMNASTDTPSILTTVPSDAELDALRGRVDHAAGFQDHLWDDAPEVTAARRRTGNWSKVVAAVTTATQLTPAASLLGLLDAALDGTRVTPADFQQAAQVVVSGDAAREVLAAAIREKSLTVPQEAHAAELAYADTALAVLHDTVLEVVAVARAVSALTDRPGDRALRAFARGLMEDAAEVHDHLRAEQRRLTNDHMTEGRLVWQFGIVRDVSNFHPWAGQLGDGSPKPDLERVAQDGGIELLELLCRPDLEPWVPTAKELTAASKAMRQRVVAYQHPEAEARQARQRDEAARRDEEQRQAEAAGRRVPSRIKVPTHADEVAQRDAAATKQLRKREAHERAAARAEARRPPVG